MEVTFCPPNSTITSPARKPPRSAGEPGSTWGTRIPVVTGGNVGSLSSNWEAIPSFSSSIFIPMYGEANSISSKRFHVVNTDDFAREIDQRPTRIALVDGSVRLNVVHSRRPLQSNFCSLALHAAHDTRGHAVLQVEGATQSHHPFTHAKSAAVTKLEGRQRRFRVNFDHS
eukprot:scaffold625_cov324-Pavlova_lutheri.AAC.105